METLQSDNNLLQKCMFLITNTMEGVNLSGILAIKYRFITSSLHFLFCHSHLSFSKEKGKVTLVEKNWCRVATASQNWRLYSQRHFNLLIFFSPGFFSNSIAQWNNFLNSWEQVSQPTQHFSWSHLLTQLIIPSRIINFSHWICKMIYGAKITSSVLA